MLALLLFLFRLIRFLGDEVSHAFLVVAEDQFAAVVSRDVLSLSEEAFGGESWRAFGDLFLLCALVVLDNRVLYLPLVVFVDRSQYLSRAPHIIGITDVHRHSGLKLSESILFYQYVRRRL